LWIEQQTTFPVEEVTIAGNLLEMFAGIEAIGSDLAFRSSVSAPTVKIAKMTVAGQG
jgi:PmbA protein